MDFILFTPDELVGDSDNVVEVVRKGLFLSDFCFRLLLMVCAFIAF